MNKINTTSQSTGKELAAQLIPLNSEVQRFHNPEQIDTIPSIDSSIASMELNLNADLGLQYKLRQMRENGIIVDRKEDGKEQPNFVIISHGHSIPGVTEMAKMRTQDGKYLFDVAVCMPLGTWRAGASRTGPMTTEAQLWGDELERERNNNRQLQWAGGIAVALNGHRGDLDYNMPDKRAANIDPKAIFGSVEDFEKFLLSKNMKRIVIVTEHLVADHTKNNYLPLDILTNSDVATFDEANKDLYHYMKELNDR
jgi:hypothetical protein